MKEAKIIPVKNKVEEIPPNPEFLIRSIAEQGYSLETAVADLIDNSITAGASHIDILVDVDKEPFTFFIADNGNGMSERKLKECMRFPSSFVDATRAVDDLGRFGLGLKTASFSQTRRFTVLSREHGEEMYRGRTWDVEFLHHSGKWEVLVCTDEEVIDLLADYRQLYKDFLNQPVGFEANTVVIWQGLYKFEKYLDGKDKRDAIKHQISDVATEYLSLVFHRFLERQKNRVSIRVNHRTVQAFNPFPDYETDFRLVDNRQREIGDDVIRIEGFILPARSIDESRDNSSVWTTKTRGLMDLEGIYVYRADRIIVFGGWNNVVRKSPVLRLARMRVEVGNAADHLFHLNVAKSQVTIPFNLKTAFLRDIATLKKEAEREYYNRGVRKFGRKGSSDEPQLFDKLPTNRGTLVEINNNFPLLDSLRKSLTKEQLAKFNFLMRMVNTAINTMRHVHENADYNVVDEESKVSVSDMILSVRSLLEAGVKKKYITESLLPTLGYKEGTIPDEINELLN